MDGISKEDSDQAVFFGAIHHITGPSLIVQVKLSSDQHGVYWLSFRDNNWNTQPKAGLSREQCFNSCYK